MPEQAPFRLVDEKHVTAVVTQMLWSPKMDLIAVANVQGEVLLYRLQWQRVWSVAAPIEGEKVTSLAWRTDGKVLAIGYSGGKINLCDVENSTVLHSLKVIGQVNSMTWMCESPVTNPASKTTQDTVKECFVDQSSKYLPRLLPFAKTYGSLAKGHSEENVEDTKKLKDQTDLNILIVGCTTGKACLYAYGVFPIATVDISSHTEQNCKVLSGMLSHDLRLLTLLIENDDSAESPPCVKMISYDTTLLASRHKELRILGLKFGQISTLMGYMGTTIHQMCEAWEDILLEMDSKLMKFAEQKAKQSSGTISNDFLELLMFGTPSDDLQAFLLHELTEKGLRKLGHSIETSYSNIQKLVLKHLQIVGQALIYHLSDLKGMALWYDKFGVLGLSPQGVTNAVSIAGSFMLKASELQQVIDGSMKNFKAFFRWLYVIIQRLSDEPIPAELSKMTQQDLNFVAQFLKDTFTEEENGEETNQKFKLERVGQYLKKEDLHDLPDISSNSWLQFLNSSTHIKESPFLYKSYSTKSLLQMHEILTNSINTALTHPASVIGQSLQCTCMSPLLKSPSQNEDGNCLRFSQMSMTDKAGACYLYTAFTAQCGPCDKCFLMRQNTRRNHGQIEVVTGYFNEIGSSELDDSTMSHRCDRHQILDLCFYDEDTLSVLLQEVTQDAVPVLVQVKLSSIENHVYTAVSADQCSTASCLADHPDINSIDFGSSVDHMNFRRLENMKASALAVSGTRKVACVLFSSRRRVRLFLMDVEDEDDDEEDDDDDDELDDTADETKTSRDAEAKDGLDEEEENAGDEDKENTSRDSAGMDV